MSIAKKYLYLSVILAVIILLCLCILLVISHHRNETLESRVQELESILAQQEQVRAATIARVGPGTALSPVEQQIKDLSTRFVGDSRTLSEKLRDFTAENPDAQHFAIASKVVADLVENRDALGDEELVWLYPTQTDPGFKRVIAQVLSARGDNQLLDGYIAALEQQLANSAISERRQILGELGKTRYQGAANIILPMLKDKDTSVLLDALLALRNTANEGQLDALDKLHEHPDESVRWLAGDTANNLQMLSKKARMHVTMADIVAELPPIAAQ
ncbi:HEAT repeat domain-containing protein [Cellvibrio mixtus]|uniref:HEAT repeat domain-containing protein n=1 Tax=Cellvibrio mixtus TaxID=39650 RepID=UPI001269BD00|nr:HEAT repeat domain-containing protein [Cellvibrio mixtus]